MSAIVLIAGAATPALCWWGVGHNVLTKAAVRALPADMPAFFRAAEIAIAHCSVDPDVVKNTATPQLKDTESPEHYLDAELLRGAALPATRYAYVRLCDSLHVRPETVGFLPYAVAEWTERLAVALAEYRKWPDNAPVQTKCLVYAGILSHYAEDLCQPLHVTVDFDGRARADNSSPRSGIHNKVDGLVEVLKLSPDSLATKQTPHSTDSLMPWIVARIGSSRAEIDSTYALEKPLMAQKSEKPDPRVARFANRRAREAVGCTASLYLTAWKLSSTIKLDGWLDRAALDASSSAGPVR